jgi:hypothetical protein
MRSVRPAIECVMPRAPFQRVVALLAIARERGAVRRGAVPRSSSQGGTVTPSQRAEVTG